MATDHRPKAVQMDGDGQYQTHKGQHVMDTLVSILQQGHRLEARGDSWTLYQEDEVVNEGDWEDFSYALDEFEEELRDTEEFNQLRVDLEGGE